MPRPCRAPRSPSPVCPSIPQLQGTGLVTSQSMLGLNPNNPSIGDCRRTGTARVLGPFKAGDDLWTWKMQQLELSQPPPSLENIPAEGGFGCRVKGEGWGVAWQRNEAQESRAVLWCHSCGVTHRDAREKPWLRARERCRTHPLPCSLS